LDFLKDAAENSVTYYKVDIGKKPSLILIRMKAPHILNMFQTTNEPGDFNELNELRNTLLLHVTLDQEAAIRFFKISEGSYGAGDKFLGITVPHL
jgi:hypothetical protein